MHYVTLTLTPEDLPFRASRVDVPLHPSARAANGDQAAGIGFPIASHRTHAEAVTYAIPLEMADTFTWYDERFTWEGCVRSVSKGLLTDRTVLTVSLPENPYLFIQLTFRPRGDGLTLVTYRAEEHPAPRRDPASYLSNSTERVEVHYTFLNGPKRTIQRTVTDPAAVRALVDAINSFPRVNWACSGGTFWPGGWADLRVMAPGEPERSVHVDASHGVVVVDDFPALQGSLWLLLVKVAPPPKGASGIPGIDWENSLGS